MLIVSRTIIFFYLLLFFNIKAIIPEEELAVPFGTIEPQELIQKTSANVINSIMHIWTLLDIMRTITTTSESHVDFIQSLIDNMLTLFMHVALLRYAITITQVTTDLSYHKDLLQQLEDAFSDILKKIPDKELEEPAVLKTIIRKIEQQLSVMNNTSSNQGR